jgi:hypothetical protein
MAQRGDSAAVAQAAVGIQCPWPSLWPTILSYKGMAICYTVPSSIHRAHQGPVRCDAWYGSEDTSGESTQVFVAGTRWDNVDTQQHFCVLTSSGPLLGELAQVNGPVAMPSYWI